MLFIGRSRALDLLNVSFHVLGIAFDEIEQGHAAAFSVIAAARESVFRESLEKFVIFRAQLAEGFERLRNLAPLIIQMVRPKFAVERLQRGILLGCDLTHAHDGDNF